MPDGISDSTVRWGSQYMFDYADKLYSPTSARFGPFVLGMLVAIVYDGGKCNSASEATKTVVNVCFFWMF